MSTALGTSLGIVAYLTLFTAVGFVFLFVNLLLGRFVRPCNPSPEKLEIYECGEPSIGSSYVQFDLRFYVVALLFIIFDVEVALFFPWAAVFGKVTNLADPRLDVVASAEGESLALTEPTRLLYRELGLRSPQLPAVIPAHRTETRREEAAAATEIIKRSARQLAWLSIVDIGLFFAVLLVGFAYVWKRGDLDWVRAVGRERPAVNG
jgi:NADH-quinone oxidoreductase subunit A